MKDPGLRQISVAISFGVDRDDERARRDVDQLVFTVSIAQNTNPLRAGLLIEPGRNCEVDRDPGNRATPCIDDASADVSVVANDDVDLCAAVWIDQLNRLWKNFRVVLRREIDGDRIPPGRYALRRKVPS
jgi:hypothetical protein